MSSNTRGQFTGFHMATILVAFFGIVIAVNFTMARFAVGTFGGTVVDNSYVASQNYNRWLADAARQDALGWTSKVTLSKDRHVQITASKGGVPLIGLQAAGTAQHPLGRAPSIPLRFAPMGDDKLRSVSRLPAGRWTIALSLRRGPDTYKLTKVLQ